MKKIYELSGSYGDNCIFIEDYSPPKESIMSLAIDQEWKPFKSYIPVKLELYKSDTGKKNYKFDFSAFLNPFLIFSENSLIFLEKILSKRGQFLEVHILSKRKKFIGYYPTNCFKSGILDLEKSIYEKHSNGLLIRKVVLKRNKIPDDYLFTIEEDISRVFVTDKFKQLIEKNHLIGFEFSEYNEIELS